jgi:hypothetical protein
MVRKLIYLLVLLLLATPALGYTLPATNMSGDINFRSYNASNVNALTFDAAGPDIDLNGRKFTDQANGTAAQDGATYSQTLHSGSNSSLGGYAITNQLAPSNVIEVFRYTVPWIGYKVTVAKAPGWLPIAASTNNTSVIQTALTATHAAGGGQVRLMDMFTGITTTLNQYGDAPLVGLGPRTGLTGNASPLINFTRHASGTKGIAIQDMTIRTTGASNDGVRSYLGCDGAIFNRVNFTTDGSSGALLNLTWWNNGVLRDCQFMQEDEDESGIGLKIWGSGSTYQSINMLIDGCMFAFFNNAIYVSTDTSSNIAGIYLTSSTLGWNDVGLNVVGGGAIHVSSCMLDGNTGGGILLDDVDEFGLIDSYIGVSSANADCVYVSLAHGGAFDFKIADNFFYNYEAVPNGWGIEVVSSNTNALVYFSITGNVFRHQAGGIKLYQSSGSTKHAYFTIGHNVFDGCSYASIYVNGGYGGIVNDNFVVSSGAANWADFGEKIVKGNYGITDV